MNYKKVFSYYASEENGLELYQLLNELFYDGELPEVSVKYQKIKREDDHHSIQVNGEFHLEDEEEGRPVILLDPSVISVGLLGDNWKRRFYRLCGDMLHEMVHYYCSLNRIAETDNRGVYHNTAFRNVATNHGLNVGLNMKHPELDGYNSTICTAPAEQAIARCVKHRG